MSGGHTRHRAGAQEVRAPRRELWGEGAYETGRIGFKVNAPIGQIRKFVMKQPALIIFARQPVPGETKTRLQPDYSPEKSAEIAAFMIRHDETPTPRTPELAHRYSLEEMISSKHSTCCLPGSLTGTRSSR